LQFDLERLRESLGYAITSDSSISSEEKSKLIQEMAQGFAAQRKKAEVDLQATFLKKLGLFKSENSNIVDLLINMMEDVGADFTATFRQLSEVR
jgi:uncharacterized protein YdiU (UPF0061 family)